MTATAWGNATIKCATIGCAWSGREVDMVPDSAATPGASHKNVCPKCGGDSLYLHLPEDQMPDDVKALRVAVERAAAALRNTGAADAATIARQLEQGAGLLHSMRAINADAPAATLQPITLAGLPFEMTKDELDGFYRFCESVSTLHGHGVSDELLQRLTVIGLVRQTIGQAFEVTEFGVALNSARLPLPAMEWAIDPANPCRARSEANTVKLLKSSYRISGYVMRHVDQEDVCIVDYGTVRWLGDNEMFGLLHRGPEKDLTSAESQIAKVRDAVHGYYEALDNREHGGVAQHRAFEKIEGAIGQRWLRGLASGSIA
jgi:hypothetical protein